MHALWHSLNQIRNGLIPKQNQDITASIDLCPFLAFETRNSACHVKDLKLEDTGSGSILCGALYKKLFP